MTSLAVIRLQFDPVVELLGFAIRWQALAVAGAVLLSLLLAAMLAERSGRAGGLRSLRPDDLLYITIAAFTGAVVGGRLVHGLVYADVYAAEPQTLLDPVRGSLSLLGAVVGGALTGGYVARLLDGFAGRWADVVSVPLLLAIGLGKLAQVLGGAGLGAPWDGPWATVFVGAGPWLSPEPNTPAHPSQVYEALWAFAGIPVVWLVGRRAVVERLPGAVRQTGRWIERRRERLAEVVPGDLRFGTRFVVALGWICLGRFIVGFTWRDDRILLGLNGEQLVALAVLALLAVRALLAGLLHPGRTGREERWHIGHRRYRLPERARTLGGARRFRPDAGVSSSQRATNAPRPPDAAGGK
jgi:prolipoprotein diacylglyceryltransferase